MCESECVCNDFSRDAREELVHNMAEVEYLCMEYDHLRSSIPLLPKHFALNPLKTRDLLW